MPPSNAGNVVCCLGLLLAWGCRIVAYDLRTPPPAHSVSGFSAGASVAVNHLVAFSDVVAGLGIIGGSPYGCYKLPDSGNTCSGFVSTGAHLENKTAPWNAWVDGPLAAYLARRWRQGLVPSPKHLASKPVYLFSGTDDVWVYQSVMKGVERQFLNLSSRVKSEFSLYAAHSWVVDSTTCTHPGKRPSHQKQEHQACCGIKTEVGDCAVGDAAAPYAPTGCCGLCHQGDMDDRPHPPVPKTIGWRPPINSCDFDMTGEILRWIYGDARVRPRKPVVPGNLLAVNQSQYLPADGNWTVEAALLDELGLVYVPTRCRLNSTERLDDAAANTTWLLDQRPGHMWSGGPLFSSGCLIHVHYHPCDGSLRSVGYAYFLENALPAYAEGNDMVVLYPQSAAGDGNPAGTGCFDWYGAVEPHFDTAKGVQLNTVQAMLRGLQGDHRVL